MTLSLSSGPAAHDLAAMLPVELLTSGWRDAHRLSPALPAAVAPPRRNAAEELVVREIPRWRVTSDVERRWRDLQARSCHSNAFLSPDFLLPAWSFLEPDGESFLLTVEEPVTERLLALGCFNAARPNRLLPTPHLVAARTVHSFRTGILLDDRRSDAALDAWLHHLRAHRSWGGIVFPNLRLDSILAQRLRRAVARWNLTAHTFGERSSAALFPPLAAASDLGAHLSAERRKSLRRSLKQLEARGPVSLRRVTEPHEISQAITCFLDLEHAGWKGEAGTSMRSTPWETGFLRESARRFFDRGELVLTQLLVGRRVAATAVNLLSGSTLFAFKIGWDPEFAKGSPGTLHEQQLLPFVCAEFPRVTCLDSCAAPGSYLDDLWPHRIPVGRLVIPTSRLAQGAVASLQTARRLHRHLRDWQG